jgi:hypothetical protein
MGLVSLMVSLFKECARFGGGDVYRRVHVREVGRSRETYVKPVERFMPARMVETARC